MSSYFGRVHRRPGFEGGYYLTRWMAVRKASTSVSTSDSVVNVDSAPPQETGTSTPSLRSAVNSRFFISWSARRTER